MTRRRIEGVLPLETVNQRTDATRPAADLTGGVKLLAKIPFVTVRLGRRADRTLFAHIVAPLPGDLKQHTIDLGRKRITDHNVAKAIVTKKLGRKCEQIIFEGAD
ncbi:MAG TPA: hypothetical protein VGR84_15505 [Candidatus Acidoferrales bacterium]|nr:hypothetical protein [Candidatus Acidoferrales bacterium]